MIEQQKSQLLSLSQSGTLCSAGFFPRIFFWTGRQLNVLPYLRQNDVVHTEGLLDVCDGIPARNIFYTKLNHQIYTILCISCLCDLSNLYFYITGTNCYGFCRSPRPSTYTKQRRAILLIACLTGAACSPHPTSPGVTDALANFLWCGSTRARVFAGIIYHHSYLHPFQAAH